MGKMKVAFFSLLLVILLDNSPCMGSAGSNKTLVIQLRLPEGETPTQCHDGRSPKGPGWLRFVREAGGSTSESEVNMWITVNYQVLASIECPDNGCNRSVVVSCSSSNNDTTLSLNITLPQVPQDCCVTRTISKCGANSGFERLFCRMSRIRAPIMMTCGMNHIKLIDQRDRKMKDCSSSTSRKSEVEKRNCLSTLMTFDDMDAENDDNSNGGVDNDAYNLSDPTERKMFFQSIDVFRNDLCIGSIARNIRRGLGRGRKNQISDSSYNTIMGTLSSIFNSSFSSNWKNRTKEDTKEIVDTTEELLQQLAEERMSEGDNFSFISQILAYDVVKLQEPKSTTFLFPPESIVTEHGILRKASVNISFSEERVRDCNITIGVSLIENYVEYIQQTILESDNGSDHRVPASLMMSVVVLNSTDSGGSCFNFAEEPITLTFIPKEGLPVNYSNFEGYYLNISNSSLSWDDSGLMTDIQSNGSVLIRSTHLTSFAVLVSPTGGIDKTASSSNSTAEKNLQLSLSIVSYLGCSVSIVCLILTIACLLVYRKKLNKGVLLYVHVNLAIALLLAISMFTFGVDLASSYSVLCKVMTALTQYFFLTAFLWMLGEGVILYVLLVRVFGNLADKWYILIPFCWGLPVPVVAIAAGFLHEKYITNTTNSFYCWIDADPSMPAIWTFLGPMLLIICINAVILVLSMLSILRTRLFVRELTEKSNSSLELVKVTLKGSVILLPLLGVTWVLGVFAVNYNTAVFSWLFTIFNSLQGLFIFVIHVLRNDYIWGRVKKFLCGRFRPEKSENFNAKVTRNGSTTTAVTTTQNIASVNKQCLSSSTSQIFKSESDSEAYSNKRDDNEIT